MGHEGTYYTINILDLGWYPVLRHGDLEAVPCSGALSLISIWQPQALRETVGLRMMPEQVTKEQSGQVPSPTQQVNQFLDLIVLRPDRRHD